MRCSALSVSGALRITAFQRDRSRKQNIVFEVDMYVKVGFQSLQPPVERTHCGASIRRKAEVLRENTDLSQRVTGALMFMLHSRDGVGDRPERNRRYRPIGGFGTAVLFEYRE